MESMNCEFVLSKLNLQKSIIDSINQMVNLNFGCKIVQEVGRTDKCKSNGEDITVSGKHACQRNNSKKYKIINEGS